ncbi:hypothetical protein AMTR_s00046p00221970 [Amborella trichopoda]|uniref:Peptidase M3A/M3B catalytic domain-containing protein n=1 Tax=Amborella trichopoda TaxID=13333 RepID=U5D6L5_AMBTC|nr:hypothetical protein AMTR_s00046p00221970 [Amborella trichopoda]
MNESKDSVWLFGQLAGHSSFYPPLNLQEELRPFFSLTRVMEGLFNLSKMLFDIEIESADGVAPIRYPYLFGSPIAYFYFDPYSRPSNKSGGAWMDVVVSRSRAMSRSSNLARLPIAHMVCNQTPPVGGPSLLTFREFCFLILLQMLSCTYGLTLRLVFHEFGHALQHMLTKEDEGLVSGNRGIEWDAVELPSQFMENWCYHRNTLMSIAKHYKTGESLPEVVYSKLLAARTFRKGTERLRQIRFAIVDLELHTKYLPGGSESIFDVDNADHYDAGYYSYQWAEVMSADAFSAFEEVGLGNSEVKPCTT